MKYINHILASICLIGLFTACNDETEPVYTGANIVSAQFTSPQSGKSYVLTPEHDQDAMDTFQWSVTDFGIPVGIRYVMQMDKSDGDFSKPYVLVNGTTASQVTLTVKQVNDAMMALKCLEEAPTSMKFRLVTQAMGGESGTTALSFPVQYSSDYPLTITPYKGEIPVKSPLYIVGSVFEPGYSWTNSLDAVGTGLQPFYSDNNVLGDGKYTYTGYFPAAKEMKFVVNPGSWEVQYGLDSPGKLRARDASGEGGNIPVPDGGGWYRLDVDIVALTYSFTKVVDPSAESPYSSVIVKGDAVTGGEVAMTQFSENPHIWLVQSTALNLSGDGVIFETNTGEYWGCPADTDDSFPFGKGSNNDDIFIKPLNEGNYCIMFNDLTKQYTFVNLSKY